VAEPARVTRRLEAPPVDSEAVGRAYRIERARRRARVERARARRLAGIRFLGFVAALLALTVFLSLTIWQEIERLFGL
jgi:hypothetical protein